MGFDKNSEGQPVVQTEKPTTQVNISMVVAVVLFFMIGVGAMVWLHHRAPDHSDLQPTEQHTS